MSSHNYAAPSMTGQPNPLTRRFTAALLLGVTLNPLNTSVIATALVSIGEYFSVGAAQTALLVSVLYVVSAVCQPLMGRIAQRYGARNVFVAGLVLAGIGGLIGWLASTFEWVVTSRIVLGLGTASAYPTAMMMIRSVADTYKTPVPTQLLSVVAASGHVMAAVGLPIGGVLVSIFGWRAVFAMNVPLAVITVLLVLLWVRAEGVNERFTVGSWTRQFDPVGVLIFTGFIICAMLALRDFTHLNVPAVLGLMTSCFALWLWSHQSANPLLDVRKLWTQPALVRTYARLMLSFAVLYAVLYGVTQWLEQARGLEPSVVGLLMVPMSALSAISSLAVGRSGKVRAHLVWASALMVATAGVLALAAGLSGATVWSVAVAVAGVTLSGVAMGLANVGNQAMLYIASPPEDMGVNSGFYRTASYLGGFVATGVIATLFSEGASDVSMLIFALVFVVLGAVLVVLTVTDRQIPVRS